MAKVVLHGFDEFTGVFFDSFEGLFEVYATANGNGNISTPGHLVFYSNIGDQLTFDLTGSFAQVDHSAPITGTVTGMSVTNSSDRDMIDITGFNVDLSSLAAAGQNIEAVLSGGGQFPLPKVMALYNLILGGHDTVKGDASQDDIFGLGGHDTLTGGTQSDFFEFFAPYMKARDSDTITDFSGVGSAHADFLEVDHAAVGIHHRGHLRAGEFKLAQGPGTAHIFENPVTGDLFYDPDGQGARGKIEIAKLLNHGHAAHVDSFHILLF